jgi:hypothetical protein
MHGIHAARLLALHVLTQDCCQAAATGQAMHRVRDKQLHPNRIELLTSPSPSQ